MPLPGSEPLFAAVPEGTSQDALLQALAAHSREGLALLDPAGTILWANAAFDRLAGRSPGTAAGAPLAQVLPGLPAGPFASRIIQAPQPADAPRWLDAAATATGVPAFALALSVSDATHLRRETAERQRLAELLEMAQEFGRLGVWERDLRTMQGRWDRHVFRFWGLDPSDGTPDFDAAARAVHPDDDAAQVVRNSLRQAGTYSHRYRVLRADGSVRLLHSLWEVKNGPDGRPARALGIMMDDTEVFELARSASEAHEQLNMAVDLANIGIWRHDLRTGRMHYSARTWEILDLEPRPEGLSLQEVRDLIHPDDIPKVLASAERTLATGRPTDMEARYRRRDGTWRYVLNRRALQRDVNGQAVAFVGVGLDVTEQVESSRMAEALSRRLQTAARVARVGLWTIEPTSGRLEWNAQTSEFFDLTPDQAPATFADWLQRCVHPEDQERVRQVSTDWLRAGSLSLLEVEYRTLRADGSVRWLVNRSDMDPESDGRYVFGVTLDVTEQHATLEALRNAGERSMLAARGVGMGTWQLDLRTGESFWDEQMFLLRGLPPQPGAPSAAQRRALVHPDDQHIVDRALEDAMTNTRPATYEFRVRMPDGSWRWLASRSTTVLDEHGRPVRRIGVNWDVTDVKNAELARQEKTMAQRASEAKSQFLARMSHELRTPLNAVLGFTQLLQAEADRVDPGSLRLRLGHIRSAGQHLLSLINDVLELSSLDTGELRMSVEPVSLATLVHGTLPLVERLAQEYGVRVLVGSVHGHALADPTRLRQVLLNLLSNAIKYNQPGGQVLVEAFAEDGLPVDDACLRVSDTGRGMTPQQMRHAFEPFNRLGIEREGIEGTGIGLTIVKALVERMGGEVRLSSQPAVGSIFEVRLPRAADVGDDLRDDPPADSVLGALQEPVHPLDRQRSGRLLYIEDNPVNVLLVHELVAMRPGLRLDVAADGESGFAMAIESRPDLILVDMQLPDIDGHEVRRRLRADPRTAHIPCIALSANAMPEDIERALQNGFADYWTKPLDFKAFMAAIDALFGPVG